MRPGKNDRFTHKSLEFNLRYDKKMIPEKIFESPTPKKVTVKVYPLEKYILR